MGAVRVPYRPQAPPKVLWLGEEAVPQRTLRTHSDSQATRYLMPLGKGREETYSGSRDKPALALPEVRDESRVDTPSPWKLPYQG